MKLWWVSDSVKVEVVHERVVMSVSESLNEKGNGYG